MTKDGASIRTFPVAKRHRLSNKHKRAKIAEIAARLKAKKKNPPTLEAEAT